MGRHEGFLELCTAATAGELSADEHAKLNAHLAGCPECRRAMLEYEAAARRGAAAFAEEVAPKEQEDTDSSWCVERAEKAFFKRLENELKSGKVNDDGTNPVKSGQRFTYRPSQVRWRERWMPFAAAVLLALALAFRLSHGRKARYE